MKLHLSVTALAACALAGCMATVADLRAGSPFIETTTSKSVQAYTSCLADRWAARSGQVNTTPRPNGSALTLSYPTYQGTINAATVDVDDKGASRTVIVYARKGDAGDKLRGEVTSCL